MNIQITFKNIVDSPMCSIYLNNQELFNGLVPNKFDQDVNVHDGECTLTINHYDKKHSDTIVVDGVIVRDRSFEISNIVIDGQDIEELIWESEFQAETGEVYKSCLFFGPNGKFILKFVNPVLKWILKTRHDKNGNDPFWEEDYNYYQQACKILKLTSTK